MRACVVHRDDGTLAFRQEMSEQQNRALFEFDIVRRGHGDLRMAKHPLRRDQPEAGIDLRAEFLSECMQWRA